MKNRNYPLLIGSLIVSVLIVMALYPGFFTNTDPLFKERAKYIEYKKDGKWVEEFSKVPFPPNKENIMGSDDDGRDVYARLIYGGRNTLKLGFLIGIFRMLLALPLGLAAGMGIKSVTNIIKLFNTFFTAIPMLLFSFIVLNIDYFNSLQMDQAILAFTIVLTIVGWGKLAAMIEDSTKRIMEEDFIEGEIATGKTKLQIAYQNVIPHLIPNSISLFFKEVAMALFLVAQLAVLYVFVGATKAINAPTARATEVSIEPEWGGALSRLQYNIRRYKVVNWEYWLTIYPVLFFSVAIIGINLTGEGLRIEFQKRESRVISSIKKVYYLASPRIFMAQIKDIKKYYKPVILKTLTILMIFGYFIFPWHPSKYQFDINYARTHLEELIKEKYGGRVTGTEGGYLAGEYIKNTLQDYGYQVDTMEIPLTTVDEDGNSHLHELAPMVIESGWIKLKDGQGEEKTYQLHKDFSIVSLDQKVLVNTSKDAIHYKGVIATPENATNLPEGLDILVFDPNFQPLITQPDMLLSRVYEQKTIDYGLNYDLKFAFAEGFNQNTNTYCYQTTTIIPFDELRIDLQNGPREVEINFDYPQLPEHPVRSITAFLPGKGRSKEDPGELIIIGATYDGIQINGVETPYAMSATPAAIALEIARKLSLIEEHLEKSIQFIFWDNDFDNNKYSTLDSSYYYLMMEKIPIQMAMTHRYYYFEINLPGFDKGSPLKLITYPTQRPDKNSYLMGLDMEKRLNQLDVKHIRSQNGYNAKPIRFMIHNSLTSAGLGSESMWGINSWKDSLQNINYKQMENIGQILLDTITMNQYIMD